MLVAVPSSSHRSPLLSSCVSRGASFECLGHASLCLLSYGRGIDRWSVLGFQGCRGVVYLLSFIDVFIGASESYQAFLSALDLRNIMDRCRFEEIFILQQRVCLTAIEITQIVRIDRAFFRGDTRWCEHCFYRFEQVLLNLTHINLVTVSFLSSCCHDFVVTSFFGIYVSANLIYLRSFPILN